MKFRIKVISTQTKLSTYEVEAKNLKDFGICVDEKELEYNEIIDSVEQIKEKE